LCTVGEPAQARRLNREAAGITNRRDQGGGTQAVILAKKGRRTPALHDWREYRLRNQIERLFNKLKNWRRVATRYDKSKSSYLGFVSLASALLRLPFVHET